MVVVVGPGPEPPAARLRVGRDRHPLGVPALAPQGRPTRRRSRPPATHAGRRPPGWRRRRRATPPRALASGSSGRPCGGTRQGVETRPIGSSGGRTTTAGGASSPGRPATGTPPGRPSTSWPWPASRPTAGGPPRGGVPGADPEGRRVVADDPAGQSRGPPLQEPGADHLLRQRLGDARADAVGAEVASCPAAPGHNGIRARTGIAPVGKHASADARNSSPPADHSPPPADPSGRLRIGGRMAVC